MADQKIHIAVTPEDAARIREALDSHMYWQLADEDYRENGSVRQPGSDDADTADEIHQCERLRDEIEQEIPL